MTLFITHGEYLEWKDKEKDMSFKDSNEQQIFDTIAILYEMHENHLTKMQDHFVKVFEEKDV
jgi:hypothetical protein